MSVPTKCPCCSEIVTDTRTHKCTAFDPSVRVCASCKARVEPRISDGVLWCPVCANDFKSGGVVDHGNPREMTGNGASRETTGGRGRYDLIPPWCLEQIARHYENGAVKYGDRNWEKGIPLARFVESLMRHTVKLTQGDTSEDHVSAIVWNAWGYAWTEREITEGRLPASLAESAPWKR